MTAALVLSAIAGLALGYWLGYLDDSARFGGWVFLLFMFGDPFDIEDRIPDGPETVYWWRRFWSSIVAR